MSLRPQPKSRGASDVSARSIRSHFSSLERFLRLKFLLLAPRSSLVVYCEAHLLPGVHNAIGPRQGLSYPRSLQDDLIRLLLPPVSSELRRIPESTNLYLSQRPEPSATGPETLHAELAGLLRLYTPSIAQEWQKCSPRQHSSTTLKALLVAVCPPSSVSCTWSPPIAHTTTITVPIQSSGLCSLEA